MNKILLVLALFAFMLSSCQLKSEYSTKGTDIILDVDEDMVSASFIKVNVNLTDDRSYYLCGVLPDTVYKAKVDNDRFMNLCIDYSYKEYINWRYELLKNDEKYIASFADHCLCYGSDSRFFSGLNPSTRYIVYAFCVNPDTMKPVGELVYDYITTLPVRRSDLTFKVLFEYKNDEPYITIIPSNDYEPFLFDYVDKKKTIAQYGSLEAYCSSTVKFYKDKGLSNLLRLTGFQSHNASAYLEDGIEYSLLVAGYDGETTTDLYIYDFLYPFN